MPVDTRVTDALRLDKLDLPPKPRVLAIEAEDYVDWSGDEALRVLVTIAEDTADEELRNGPAIIQLKNAIRDSIRAKGITLFPYIRVGKPSEFLPGDDEG
jgi:hypothetical protein